MKLYIVMTEEDSTYNPQILPGRVYTSRQDAMQDAANLFTLERYKRTWYLETEVQFPND